MHLNIVITVAAVTCVGLDGRAQDGPVMKPVDQGVADMGPLSGPGRALSPGLRQPSGYDRVYEVEIDGKKYFARQNGATVAVFPRSAYTVVQGRVMPVVPAGTTFYLGGLPASNPASTPTDFPSNYAGGRAQSLSVPLRSQNTRMDLSASALPAGGRPPARNYSLSVPASSGSLWQSESYRAQRTGELIDAALAATKGS